MDIIVNLKDYNIKDYNDLGDDILIKYDDILTLESQREKYQKVFDVYGDISIKLLKDVNNFVFMEIRGTKTKEKYDSTLNKYCDITNKLFKQFAHKSDYIEYFFTDFLVNLYQLREHKLINKFLAENQSIFIDRYGKISNDELVEQVKQKIYDTVSDDISSEVQFMTDLDMKSKVLAKQIPIDYKFQRFYYRILIHIASERAFQGMKSEIDNTKNFQIIDQYVAKNTKDNVFALCQERLDGFTGNVLTIDLMAENADIVGNYIDYNIFSALPKNSFAYMISFYCPLDLILADDFINNSYQLLNDNGLLILMGSNEGMSYSLVNIFKKYPDKFKNINSYDTTTLQTLDSILKDTYNLHNREAFINTIKTYLKSKLGKDLGDQAIMNNANWSYLICAKGTQSGGSNYYNKYIKYKSKYLALN